MAYEHITFADAKTLLAQRLEDSSKVFWVDAELGAAIVEALRMWNAITLFDRDIARLTPVENTPFYQFTTTLTGSGGGLIRAQTIRDRTLVSEIEYHLVEAQGLSAWAGTDQFTLPQIVSALQRRRDQFLADTACVVSEYTSDLISGSGDGLITLPDNVIGIRRAVFRDINGRYHTLRTSDERMAMTSGPYWWTPGTPTAYSVSVEPNLSIRMLPPPALPGYLELLVVTTGAVLGTTANGATGTLLGVPDDLAWGVKYGALADILRDFASTDSQRADTCQQLYDLAVQLAINMPVILHASIDNRPVVPAALSHTDTADNGWQGNGSDAPTTLSTVGPDLIALSPLPDSNPHIVHLNVVRAATVPTASGDFLNIGREQLDALLGMAQRICMFKCGGSEYAETEPLGFKFFDQAQQYAYRRSAVATALQAISRYSTQDTDTVPWSHVPRTVEDRPDEVKSERNARRRPFRKT